MTDTTEPILTRGEISAAVTPLGWRLILNELRTAVAIESYDDGLRLITSLAAVPGVEEHLRVDLRRGVVGLGLRPADGAGLTRPDLELAAAVTDAVRSLGRATGPDAGGGHPVQVLEIAIDALDIPAVKPFWAAVMGYPVDSSDGPEVVDPLGQSPTIWFQQMDEPRPQRNRIHFDIVVGHDEAAGRIEAALAAGGHLVSDAEAPAFWILADAEGNEICVCTWQARD